ncbi:MAG: hypothetical protein HDR01_03845 [Lachnospiraceae bacterium]|nr:hypothetical protein [Lachnospiraceae bacterium]
MEYTDADGNKQFMGGGGVAFADAVCYVKLVKGKETLYMTVKYKGGYATGDHKYPDPKEWMAN